MGARRVPFGSGRGMLEAERNGEDMSDLYLNITDQPDSVLDAIAAAMDVRMADPQMRDICACYMGALPRPGAEVLEIGCGNGASTELVLRHAEPRRLIGVDPSSGLLDRARERFSAMPDVSFRAGDASRTGMAEASCDVVVAHTVFSHLADPGAALAEAFRILRPGGTLAVFDGDYATNTVALFDGDPLQAAMVAAQRHLIHDPYVMRRLPGMMTACGFESPAVQAHGFIQTVRPDYVMSLIMRGTDAATRADEIGAQLADGFKAEAARRIAAGSFYGAILFVSAIARKPG